METVINNKSVQNAENSSFKLYLWVLSYLSPYKNKFFLLILCSLSISLIEMLIPKFIQHFIDVIIPDKRMTSFFSLLGMIALMLGFMFFLMVIRNNMQRDIQEKASRDLQVAVFQKLRVLGFSYFEKSSVGDTLSLLNNEISSVQQIYQSYLPKLIQNFLFVSVMTVVMFIMQWKLAMVVIPCFFLFYLFAPYLSHKASHSGRERAEKSAEMNKRMYDSLMALPEVQASGSEKWDKARLLRAVSAYNEIDVKTMFYALIRGSLRNLCISLGAIVLFLYGSYLVQTEALTVGQFVAFIFYYFMTIGMFSFIIMSVATQKALMFQAAKIHHFMEQNVDIREPEFPVKVNEVKGELTFRNVSFGYPGRPELLHNINLHIKPGEKVAIVGTSGNGKSTILKLISRFYDTNQGEIRLDGTPLHRLSFSDLRNAIGFVFQETYLFNSTIRDNIRFGRLDASDQEVEEAAHAAYAHPFIMQLPDGYETVVGERGSKLSGGQKQRIAIARMMIKNPAILLLDEATSALDHVSEKEVGMALDALFQGRTIVAVAHRISTIRQYSRIVLMEQGRIQESGTYDELMELHQLFHRLVTGRGGNHE